MAAGGLGVGGVLLVGLQGGQATLLDGRAGRLLWHWAAHSAAVSGVLCWEHQLVTASQVLPLLLSKQLLRLSRGSG